MEPTTASCTPVTSDFDTRIAVAERNKCARSESSSDRAMREKERDEAGVRILYPELEIEGENVEEEETREKTDIKEQPESKVLPIYHPPSPQPDKKELHTSRPITSPRFTITKTFSPSGKIKTTTKTQPRLLNNLLISVGFLDLASACDFAANIWNDYPVPGYAKALMTIGGLIALAVSLCALKDFRLSWPNYLLLRSERRLLKLRRREKMDTCKTLEDGLEVKSKLCMQDVECCLEVNFRDLGNEVARLGMDGIMGFGTTLIGIGTLLALGGIYKAVFHASNLLSGYIGNAPIAFYGLMNSAWSIYLWKKTYSHSHAARRHLQPASVALKLVEKRARLLRLYAMLYGLAGFFTGVGSLISATMWFGYVISFPWIITSIFCNYLFRCKIGYDRPTIQSLKIFSETRGIITFFSKDTLIKGIEDITSWISKLDTERIFKFKTGLKADPIGKVGRESEFRLSGIILTTTTAFKEILTFLQTYDLFTDYCHAIASDESLVRDLFGMGPLKIRTRGNGDMEVEVESWWRVRIDEGVLLRVHDGSVRDRLKMLAREVIDRAGEKRLRDRRRFLVEALGCWLCCGEGG